MRLYQLEYFLKIVECGSVTRAAQELYLSQPSITKAIAGLESEYDLKLFSRSAKGLRLTPKGRDFLEYARGVVDSCYAMDKTFGKKSKTSIPRITIASQQFDFIYDILLELYKENCHQALQIDLKENDRGEIVKMVEACEADIGLLVLSERDSKMFKSELKSKNLEMHTLDRSPAYVSMGKLSKFYDHESVEADEANQFLHVVLDTEQTMRRELVSKSDYPGFGHEQLIFCNTIGVCQKFLTNTDALLITPKWVLGLFSEEDIHSVPLIINGNASWIVNQLVWIKRSREELHPFEEQFMELLKGHFD